MKAAGLIEVGALGGQDPVLLPRGIGGDGVLHIHSSGGLAEVLSRDHLFAASIAPLAVLVSPPASGTVDGKDLALVVLSDRDLALDHRQGHHQFFSSSSTTLESAAIALAIEVRVAGGMRVIDSSDAPLPFGMKATSAPFASLKFSHPRRPLTMIP